MDPVTQTAPINFIKRFYVIGLYFFKLFPVYNGIKFTNGGYFVYVFKQNIRRSTPFLQINIKFTKVVMCFYNYRVIQQYHLFIYF